MTLRTGTAILAGLTALAVIGTLFVPPIPQDPAYHRFADLRGCFAIPNCGDVVSNAAFGAVGVIGLACLFAGRRRPPADTLPYAVFFAAVLLTGAGSVYYHWRPDNARLFWDRLPMAVGFMALCSAIMADRIHRAAGLRIALPLLAVLGAASVVYWHWSEQAGHGDLRFYALVQFLPVALIPLACRLFPGARFTTGRRVAWLFLWYAMAKAFELADAGTFDTLGRLVSGHTLKHLAAAIAAAGVIPMARAASRPPPARRARPEGA